MGGVGYHWSILRPVSCQNLNGDTSEPTRKPMDTECELEVNVTEEPTPVIGSRVNSGGYAWSHPREMSILAVCQ